MIRREDQWCNTVTMTYDNYGRPDESAWEKAKEGIPWWGAENPMMPDSF